jgi:hypothetical protein
VLEIETPTSNASEALLSLRTPGVLVFLLLEWCFLWWWLTGLVVVVNALLLQSGDDGFSCTKKQKKNLFEIHFQVHRSRLLSKNKNKKIKSNSCRKQRKGVKTCACADNALLLYCNGTSHQWLLGHNLQQQEREEAVLKTQNCGIDY